MKAFILIVVTLLAGLQNLWAESGDSGIFSVYLVRHAEKQANPPDPADPGLSDCGQQRAAALARIVASVDLQKVYSTPYRRTRDTARPVAEGHGLEISPYDPSGLEAFAGQLLRARENALVSGHSNTTAVLAGMLGGQEGEEFDEDIYDRFYQVIVSGSERRVVLFHQAFDCGDQDR